MRQFLLAGAFGLAVAIVASTQSPGGIDYRQIHNAPVFLKSNSIIIGSKDGRQYIDLDDSGLVRERVYPTTEPAIVPGPCRVGTDSHEASWRRIKTPRYIYECVPNGRGDGFVWHRQPVVREW